MGDLKNIKSRLNNINSVYEITDAMQVIATLVIGKAQKLLNYRKKIQPYYDRLFFTRHIERKKNEHKEGNLVVLFFSEKGFCGHFNAQLLPFLKKYKESKKIIVGTKGKLLCEKYGIKYEVFFKGADKDLSEHVCDGLFEYLKTHNFPWDLQIVINKYNNMFKQVPVAIPFFPVFEEVYNAFTGVTDIKRDILDDIILEKFVREKLFYFYIQNFTGEVASKLLMMKNAVENAGKLQEQLGKEYRKGRQKKITEDLSEVISAYKVLQSTAERR